MGTATTIRPKEPLRTEALAVLEGIGMTLPAYVNLCLQQLVNRRAIPFECTAPVEEPTDQTIRAMVEAKAKSLGLLDDDAPSFVDAASAMAFLESVE